MSKHKNLTKRLGINWINMDWRERIALIQSITPIVTHRIRRGKLVEIPEEWRGKVTHKQTIRKRKKK